MKKQLTALMLMAFLLCSTCMQVVLTTGPTQPPVVTDTLYVGRDGWGPRYADPVRAHDKHSQELIFNVYDTLIVFGKPVTNSWGTWDVHEQYWEFSPSLATNVPDRQEVIMVVPDFGINPYDPVCYWFEPTSVTPPEFAVNPFYHINGWIDNNPDGILGPCDVLYIGEYLVLGNPESIVTKRTWHILEYVPGEYLVLHHYYYDFYIRTDPVIYFYDEWGNPVDTFDVYDVEYSFERGLVQDQLGSPMWKFYKPLFDQMNSDWWDTGDPTQAYELAYMIEDAIEIVSLDPPILRINVGIPFPDGAINRAFLQILCGTWASIVSKEWCIGQGCWDEDLFSDVSPPNGYPDWWDNNRRVNSPINFVSPANYCGTGPYIVNTASSALNLVILQRNPNYWKGWPAPDRKAYLEYVDIEYIAYWTSRKWAFVACQLDVCDVPRTYMTELLDPTDPARMKTIYPEMVTIKNIAPVLSLDAVFFTFNANPIAAGIWTGRFPDGIPTDFFNNIHVRKAFSYAFDHAKYLHEVWLDEATCRETPDILGLVPDYYCHSPDPPWTYDIDINMIVAELQQAMFTQDGTTQSVWDWGGFRLTMYYNQGSEERRLACEFIQQTFNEINSLYLTNFQIVIEGPDSPTFLALMENFEMPLFVAGWQANFADADDFKRPFMHSQGYYASFQDYTANNGWATTPGPRTGLTKDVLIDLAVKTSDGLEREAMYKDLDDIYLADCPSFPIVQPLGRRWQKYWVKGWYYNALYPSDYYYHLYKEDAPWADVTGPIIGIPDGIVTWLDLAYVSHLTHWGAQAPDPARIPPYDPRWAPGTYGCGGCDVYGDRIVGMRDVGYEAAHFGEGVCPTEPEHGGNVYLNATPSKQIVGVGYNVNVSVKIDNAVDLTGYQVCLLYNASILELVSANIEPIPGWDTTIGGNVSKTCDDQQCIIVDCVKIPSSGSPFSGNITLVTFTFKGLAKGNTTLNISRSRLVAGQQEILYNPINSELQVGVPCDVTGPEDPPGSGKYPRDGVCNMRDIGYFCQAFITQDPNCDVTGPIPFMPDGIVNMRDIGESCNNFMKPDP